MSIKQRVVLKTGGRDSSLKTVLSRTDTNPDLKRRPQQQKLSNVVAAVRDNYLIKDRLKLEK